LKGTFAGNPKQFGCEKNMKKLPTGKRLQFAIENGE
jgi:hypothetical protein